MVLSQISEQRSPNFAWLCIQVFSHCLTYFLVITSVSITVSRLFQLVIHGVEMEAPHTPLYGVCHLYGNCQNIQWLDYNCSRIKTLPDGGQDPCHSQPSVCSSAYSLSQSFWRESNVNLINQFLRQQNG